MAAKTASAPGTEFSTSPNYGRVSQGQGSVPGVSGLRMTTLLFELLEWLEGVECKRRRCRPAGLAAPRRTLGPAAAPPLRTRAAPPASAA
jgi:hypothetical protein